MIALVKAYLIAGMLQSIYSLEVKTMEFADLEAEYQVQVYSFYMAT